MNRPAKQTVADADHHWAGELNGDLAAGYYTIGIADQSRADDPTFIITFADPLSQIISIPEPSTWALMLLGFASLGYAGYRGTRKPHAA